MLKVLFGCSALAYALTAHAQPSPLRVVTDNNYPPYVLLGADGLPEGYIVDLWRLWEQKTGVPVNFKAIQWSEAQRAMRDGQADVIDMMFRNPVRDQLYDFSQPYATLPVSIYVDSSIQGIQGIQSLSGFTIGVQRGDACIDELVSKGITNLLAYASYEDILRAAEDGEIKIFCMDEEPASYYLYLHRSQLRFSRAFKLYEGQFHWAVNRGDAAAFALVRSGMELITPQEREALRQKWFNQPFEFRPYLRILMWVVGAALCLVTVAGLWIRLLRQSVRSRTAEILTKNKQLEATTRELRKEEAMLRAIIDSSPDALALKSLEGVYLDCNAGLLALLRKARDEVVGRTDLEIFQDQDFVLSIRDNDRTVLRSGEPLQYETRVADSAGAVRDVEVIKVVVNDAHGEPAGILTVARDVTDRRRAERELRISAVAFETRDAMMITDAYGVIDRVNSAFHRITGYSAEQAVGRTPRFLQSGVHPPEFYQGIRSALRDAGYWQGEVVNRRQDGSTYTARLSISQVTDTHGNTLHYVGNLQDITAERLAQELAEHLKLFDSLTDLPNRTQIENRTAQVMARCAESGQTGALMMVDLDFFHRVNDSLGHSVGDRLLIDVARRIRLCTRESDVLGRFSGDKFVLVAEDVGDPDVDAGSKAQALAEGVRRAVQMPFDVEGHRLVCTASIGVTLLHDVQGTPEMMLRRAELAMYQSKREGRDTVRFFEESMQTEVERRSRLEHELREAIEHRQLVLYYQVQVDGVGQPLGAEALVRWKHPSRGIVSPAEFIFLAEETGLIDELGRWCLISACHQLALWAQQPDLRHLTVAVNISPRQFKSAHFVEEVAWNARRAGVAPEQLKLEITESLAIDEFDDSIAKLQALKEAGFKISMDDFGTGNSSLNMLTKLPLTQLKIDKSFVDDLPDSPRDMMVAQTIINMGQGLDLHVIAEGVETEAQYRVLRDLGCTAFQGYYFGRPLPVDAFESSVRMLLQPRGAHA